MKLYNLTFFVLIVGLIAYVLTTGFRYDSFDGMSGGGYKVGFILSTETIVALIILATTIAGYFAFKRVIKN